MLKQRDDTLTRIGYSIPEVAKIVGIGRTTLYKEIGAGNLVVFKIGRRTLVRKADLRAWIESSVVQLPPPPIARRPAPKLPLLKPKIKLRASHKPPIKKRN